MMMMMMKRRKKRLEQKKAEKKVSSRRGPSPRFRGFLFVFRSSAMEDSRIIRAKAADLGRLLGAERAHAKKSNGSWSAQIEGSKIGGDDCHSTPVSPIVLFRRFPPPFLSFYRSASPRGAYLLELSSRGPQLSLQTWEKECWRRGPAGTTPWRHPPRRERRQRRGEQPWSGSRRQGGPVSFVFVTQQRIKEGGNRGEKGREKWVRPREKKTDKEKKTGDGLEQEQMG